GEHRDICAGVDKRSELAVDTKDGRCRPNKGDEVTRRGFMRRQTRHWRLQEIGVLAIRWDVVKEWVGTALAQGTPKYLCRRGTIRNHAITLDRGPLSAMRPQLLLEPRVDHSLAFADVFD